MSEFTRSLPKRVRFDLEMMEKEIEMVIDQKHPLAVHSIKRMRSLRKAPSIVQELAKTVDQWGTKCDEYEAGCPICEAWKIFDATLKCPTDGQVRRVR